jgi:RimJ/RimL family protein N-acetyltransferase
MQIRKLTSRDELLGYLSVDPALNLYLIGDLDDFFWPWTTWYGLYERDRLKSVALFYTGTDSPALLLFFTGDPHYHVHLLVKIKPLLPAEFTVHLSPGLLPLFGTRNIIKNYGLHYRMILKKEISYSPDSIIRRLSTADLALIEEFYRLAYPDNWFTARMVETGKYFGYFDDGKLVGVSGVHVWSEPYSIAALGNIAVLPAYRGKGIGSRLTSALCADLRPQISTIGLNVMASNIQAVKCYERAGFEKVFSYDECLVRNE